MREKTFSEKWAIRHAWNKRTGLYGFLGSTLLKLFIILLAIGVLIWAVDYFFDIKAMIDKLTLLGAGGVLPIFLISESILGWIPPDFFITWSEQFGKPFLWLTILASISYIGGINAYFIGKLALKYPKFRSWLEAKNEVFFVRIRKWGGLVIIFAALFPLPFATTSTVAGMVKYPFKTFLLYGLTRYVRFYIYGAGIFAVMDKLM
ncbi:MAG: hypothetical protein MJZ61_01415 [Bacteroidales bacterium]|nr:hypothetical protein [Bacteroidales bacterium]